MSASPGTVLITGGSRGIGAATARLAAQRGHDVCFTYAERHDAAQQVVAELRGLGRAAHAIQADAGDAQAMATLLDRLPPLRSPLTALVNNTGVTGPLGPFAGQELATLRRVLGNRLYRAWQTLTIGAADLELAALLKVPLNAPVARIERLAVDGDGVILYSGDACTITRYCCPNSLKLDAYMPPKYPCMALVMSVTSRPASFTFGTFTFIRYCGKFGLKEVVANCISGRWLSRLRKSLLTL